MSAQHTQARLKFCETTAVMCIAGKGPFNSLKIMSPWVEGVWEGDQEAEANMRRLVACWNACQGITTEDLGWISQTGGMLGPREDVARIAAQRDELLEALREISIAENRRRMAEIARAAIAKAAGEKA